MLNWEIEPRLLAPHVPYGTELDEFEGRTFVSLVGFRFLKTRVLGIAIPMHRDFDEVNLRFYVRRRVPELRRGVVFIREVVPRWAIATVARLAYNENYRALSMAHRLSEQEVEYSWKLGTVWNRLSVRKSGALRSMLEGSLEQFIAEHYWGYSARGPSAAIEYQVAHPSWRVWDTTDANYSGDPAALYGAEFGAVLSRRPDSALLAEGSPVEVFRGQRVGARQ